MRHRPNAVCHKNRDFHRVHQIRGCTFRNRYKLQDYKNLHKELCSPPAFHICPLPIVSGNNLVNIRHNSSIHRSTYCSRSLHPPIPIVVLYLNCMYSTYFYPIPNIRHGRSNQIQILEYLNNWLSSMGHSIGHSFHHASLVYIRCKIHPQSFQNICIFLCRCILPFHCRLEDRNIYRKAATKEHWFDRYKFPDHRIHHARCTIQIHPDIQ